MKTKSFGMRVPKRKKTSSPEPTREQITDAMKVYFEKGGSIKQIKTTPEPADKHRAYANYDGEFGSILEEEERWDDF